MRKPRKQSQVSKRFTSFPFNTDQISRNDMLKKAATELEKHINEFTVEGREKSLAITNLEQAMFWTSRAIALEPKFAAPNPPQFMVDAAKNNIANMSVGYVNEEEDDDTVAAYSPLTALTVDRELRKYS